MTQQIWNDVPTQEPVLRPTQIPAYQNLQIADWCYVIALKSFVLVADPTKFLFSKNQFDDLFAHLPMPNRRGGRQKPSTYLLDHYREDRVVARMDMLTDTRSLIARDEHNLKVLNIFQHPPKPPEKVSVSHEMALEFIHYLLDGDQPSVDYLLNWIAHFVFKAHTRMHHGILISGSQGTGKSTLGKIVAELGGRSSRTITPQELGGNFQDWMLNARLVIVEEVKQQKNYEFYNNIKAYFTNDVNRVNPKGKTPFDISNHLHFMMYSNSPNPITLDEDDRRFFYRLSKAKKRDKEYYSNLHNYLWKLGGVWAFRDYLEEHYLPLLEENFAFIPPLRTADHIEAGLSSRSRLEELIETRLVEAERLFSPDSWFLFSDLKDWLDDQKNLPMLRDNSTTNAVLQQCGLVRERHTIDGKKLSVCWWKPYTQFVRPLFKDTSNKGRKRLKEQQVNQYSSNPYR